MFEQQVVLPTDFSNTMITSRACQSTGFADDSERRNSKYMPLLRQPVRKHRSSCNQLNRRLRRKSSVVRPAYALWYSSQVCKLKMRSCSQIAMHTRYTRKAMLTLVEQVCGMTAVPVGEQTSPLRQRELNHLQHC